jgi:hypothetical protein
MAGQGEPAGSERREAPEPAGAHVTGPEAQGEGEETAEELAEKRLTSGSFSSGLSVPDFAAGLQMGLRPVGFVQGFCAMQWSWYGIGSPYLRGAGPFAGGGGWGGYMEQWHCPHGFVMGSGEHRIWGQNYEQPWVQSAWAKGFGTAYERMLEEARDAGAHGVIGVVDTSRHLADASITEFHITGTAVVVDGAPEHRGEIFTTYLAGQRLAKLIEAGMMPVSVAAAMSSVRVWAYCVTELLMRGQTYSWGTQYSGSEIDQVAKAHMAARGLVRDQVRGVLAGDTLYGAKMVTRYRELGEGDEVVECTLRGTKVRRFKDFDPVPAPRPTVRLS